MISGWGLSSLQYFARLGDRMSGCFLNSFQPTFNLVATFIFISRNTWYSNFWASERLCGINYGVVGFPCCTLAVSLLRSVKPFITGPSAFQLPSFTHIHTHNIYCYFSDVFIANAFFLEGGMKGVLQSLIFLQIRKVRHCIQNSYEETCLVRVWDLIKLWVDDLDICPYCLVARCVWQFCDPCGL